MRYPTTPYFATLTVATVAMGITNETDAALETRIQKEGHDMAILTVETGGIRVRMDGTDPTTTVGLVYAAGSKIAFNGKGKLRDFRMIRDGSTTATVTVHLDRSDR